MKTQFYCSSKFGDGYVYGEKTDGGMKKIARTCADKYFAGSGISSALFRAEAGAVLVLKGIRPPVGMADRTDKTSSPIHINLALLAENDQEEAVLRSLYLFYLQEEGQFSAMLFDAYDESAGGETGYDFDRAKMNKLIICAQGRYLVNKKPQPVEESEYNRVTLEEAVAILTEYTMPGENCVYLLKTELSRNNYIRSYIRKGDKLPYYVIGGADPDDEAEYRPTDIWGKALQWVNRLRHKWLVIGGAALGLLLVFCLIILLTRTIPVENPYMTCTIESADMVTVHWQAEKAIRYETAFNGQITMYGPESTGAVFRAEPGALMNIRVTAFGRNDRKGTLVGDYSIDLSPLVPEQEPEPSAADLSGLLSLGDDKITMPLPQTRTVSVQIDSDTVLQFDLSISGDEIVAEKIMLPIPEPDTAPKNEPIETTVPETDIKGESM